MIHSFSTTYFVKGHSWRSVRGLVRCQIKGLLPATTQFTIDTHINNRLGLMLTWVCYTYFRRTFNLSIGSSWGEDSNGLPLVQGESTNHYFQSSLLIHVTIKKNLTKIYPIHLMQLKLLSTSDSMKSRNSILQRDSSSDLTGSQSVF